MYNSDREDPQFQKLFEFQRTHEWRLPKTAYSAPHFEIQELQDMKRELNAVKGKLNEFDLAKWSLHTRNRDLAGYVMGQLRKRVRPELLTQAWCKFYEIISVFPVVRPSDGGRFKSLHLCEAPGAFVCALNHYLVLNYPGICWQWLGNTLNPDYEGNPLSHMISDDRLIRFTPDNWLFGIDLTGDIQQYYNHVDIVNKITCEEKVNLVTADGSIDCMSDPGEQEKLVQFLHYCETMTALAVLGSGGSYILKIFTVFEESTICLLYLLNCVFDKAYLFKPCTSKSGNSEIYLVCIGFNRSDMLSSLWEALIGPYKKGFFDKNASMFSVDDVPSSFKVQLASCCADFFLEKQVNTINDNIYYYLHPNVVEKGYLHSRKIDIANRYIEKYQVQKIPAHCKVISYLDIHNKKNDLQNSSENQCICLKDQSLSEFVDISLGKRIGVVHTSKFASMEFIDHLIKHLNKDYISASLYNLVLQVVNTSTVVINVKDFNLIPYYKYQKALFTCIQAAIHKEKHILFLTVPFHTYFLAALWAILATTFENVYFGNGWCLFHQPIVEKLTVTKNIFSSIEKAYCNIGNSMFPCDIAYIFRPNIFYNSLHFVPEILKICNTFKTPTWLS